LEGATPPVVAPPSMPVTHTPHSSTPPNVKPTGTATSAAPKPTGTPTATATPTAATPTATTTPTPPAATPDACDACILAAGAGNLQAAAASFGRCSDAGKKTACQTAAKTHLRAVQTAAKAGDCVKAKSLMAAFAAMGVQSPVFADAAAACP